MKTKMDLNIQHLAMPDRILCTSYQVADTPSAQRRYTQALSTYLLNPDNLTYKWVPVALEMGEALQDHLQQGGTIEDKLSASSEMCHVVHGDTLFSQIVNQSDEKAALSGHYLNVIEFLSTTWDRGPEIYDWYCQGQNNANAHTDSQKPKRWILPPNFSMN